MMPSSPNGVASPEMPPSQCLSAQRASGIWAYGGLRQVRRRTRMRPPLVKRHTTPWSGFCVVFRLWMPGVVSRRWRVLPGLLSAGANRGGGTTHVWRFPPHMRDACRAASRRSSATSPGLRSLLPSEAKRGRNAQALSRARQARVRRSPRWPWATSAAQTRSERGGPSKAPGAGDRALEALGRARTQGLQPSGVSLCGAFPGWAREAAGSSAPLPARWQNGSVSTAPWRVSREETARASCWARMGQA
jgi:hypothetical protein